MLRGQCAVAYFRTVFSASTSGKESEGRRAMAGGENKTDSWACFLNLSTACELHRKNFWVRILEGGQRDSGHHGRWLTEKWETDMKTYWTLSLSMSLSLSWRRSTPSSQPNSRTMLNLWNTCVTTSAHSRVWITERSSNLPSKTLGCLTWLTVWGTRMVPRLLKVGLLTFFYKILNLLSYPTFVYSHSTSHILTLLWFKCTFRFLPLVNTHNASHSAQATAHMCSCRCWWACVRNESEWVAYGAVLRRRVIYLPIFPLISLLGVTAAFAGNAQDCSFSRTRRFFLTSVRVPQSCFTLSASPGVQNGCFGPGDVNQ